MDDRTAFVEKLEAKLEQWSADIDKMQAQAKEAGADARMKLQDEVDGLRELQKDAQARLDRLKQEPTAAWKDLKSDAERAWERMGKAIRETVNEYS